MSRWCRLHLSIITILSALALVRAEQPPGVVINYIPSRTQVYVGSPGIAVLPNGHYLAKHDEFGPKSTENTDAVTPVFRSVDRGASWQRVATVKGMYWASIFVHRGEAYLMGTSRNHGFAVISRSRDEGVTWTVPKDKSSGLLLDDAKYHCAPVPVVVHEGRIWRAMEDVMGPGGWGSHFRAFMMSAPVDSDLLNAANWVSSNPLGRDPQWLGGEFRGWLEGNAVVAPPGRIVDILRVDYRAGSEKAAIIEISADGTKATFDPAGGFIDFPGGAKKFTIRFDPVTKMYWTLSNPVLPKHKDPDPGRVRNAVALMRSADLRKWEMRCIVLYHPDVSRHGFQYLDWLFEGDDMIIASRTAWGEGDLAAPRQHDANYLTFHRIKNFRAMTMEDSAPEALHPGESDATDPSRRAYPSRGASQPPASSALGSPTTVAPGAATAGPGDSWLLPERKNTGPRLTHRLHDSPVQVLAIHLADGRPCLTLHRHGHEGLQFAGNLVPYDRHRPNLAEGTERITQGVLGGLLRQVCHTDVHFDFLLQSLNSHASPRGPGQAIPFAQTRHRKRE